MRESHLPLSQAAPFRFWPSGPEEPGNDFQNIRKIAPALAGIRQETPKIQASYNGSIRKICFRNSR